MTHAQRHASIGIHGLHAHEAAHNIHRMKLLRRAHWLALGALVSLGIGAGLVIGSRVVHAKELTQATKENVKLYVSFVNPKPGNPKGELVLPGSLQGYAETPIYARSSGFISHWYKEIGDRVKKGDLLADISTPEVAQQLLEAKAARMQIQATNQLAKTSFDRWMGLRQRDAVSQQEVDERRNTLKQTEASLAASDATVQRLEQLLSYNRIVAPFAGVITKRNAETGNLVDAGNGGAPKQLFALAQVDTLRLYVSVPQNYSQLIKAGMPAQVSLAEMPGETFTGTVMRNAGAIDPVTRTLQVEVQLPNKEGRLLPGAYVRVSFQTTRTSAPLLNVPNNALLFRPEGTLVGVVDAASKVHLKRVSIGRDLGVRVELKDGVSLQDKVIVNPPDSLAEGDVVIATVLPDVKRPEPAGPKTAGGAAGPSTGAPKSSDPVNPKSATEPAPAPDSKGKSS